MTLKYNKHYIKADQGTNIQIMFPSTTFYQMGVTLILETVL